MPERGTTSIKQAIHKFSTSVINKSATLLTHAMKRHHLCHKRKKILYTALSKQLSKTWTFASDKVAAIKPYNKKGKLYDFSNSTDKYVCSHSKKIQSTQRLGAQCSKCPPLKLGLNMCHNWTRSTFRLLVPNGGTPERLLGRRPIVFWIIHLSVVCFARSNNSKLHAVMDMKNA